MGTPEPERTPDELTDLTTHSWRHTVMRTARGFREDNLTDWAAALTYYGVLALFPALLLIMSLVGLAGPDTTRKLTDEFTEVTPGAAQDILTGAVDNAQRSQGTAGVLAIAGLVVALWSASAYVAAFMRASNAIYDVPEGRPFWKITPIRVGLTLLLVVLSVISAIAVVLTGNLAAQAGELLGIGSGAVTVWEIAKWPVLLLLVSFMFGILYWVSPNVRQPGFRWVTPGGLLAVLVWMAATAGFAVYVANFGSYNKTYGAIAGMIIFLIWLWLSNLAILLGAEFNAELQRTRLIAAGHPVEKEPFAEPRDTSKFA